MLAGSFTDLLATLAVLGTTDKLTLIADTGLLCFTLAVVGTLDTTVFDTLGFAGISTVFVGCTGTGLGDTGVGSGVTELPCLTMLVDHTGLTLAAAEVAVVFASGCTIGICTTTGFGNTKSFLAEGFCGVFAVAVFLALSTCNTFAFFTLGFAGVLAIAVSLALGRRSSTGSIDTDRLGSVFAIIVCVTFGDFGAATVQTGFAVFAIGGNCTFGFAGAVFAEGFGGVFAVAVLLAFHCHTTVFLTLGQSRIFTICVGETLGFLRFTLASATDGFGRICTLCVVCTFGFGVTFAIDTDGLVGIFAVAVFFAGIAGRHTLAAVADGASFGRAVFVFLALRRQTITGTAHTLGFVGVFAIAIGQTFWTTLTIATDGIVGRTVGLTFAATFVNLTTILDGFVSFGPSVSLGSIRTDRRVGTANHAQSRVQCKSAQ